LSYIFSCYVCLSILIPQLIFVAVVRVWWCTVVIVGKAQTEYSTCNNVIDCIWMSFQFVSIYIFISQAQRITFCYVSISRNWKYQILILAPTYIKYLHQSSKRIPKTFRSNQDSLCSPYLKCKWSIYFIVQILFCCI